MQYSNQLKFTNVKQHSKHIILQFIHSDLFISITNDNSIVAKNQLSLLNLQVIFCVVLCTEAVHSHKHT